MSTIDEVLAAAEVVDAVCVIDGETRIISVPAEYKELGVESDEKVTRVKFQCPKIVGDNIDLTEYNLYINYRNAGNKLNSYLVEDVTVTGDTINFSWLLSRHVTENPGTISYIVCAKKSDNTGVINEWNTKVATGIVGIGLEATEEIEEQNIDIIEQILRSIVDIPSIDETLTEQGKAADAKATGDRLDSLSEEKVNRSALSLGFGTDGKLYIMVSGVPTGSGVEINGSIKPSEGVVVFAADFSGLAPSAAQFYSWEGRIYDNAIYDALKNIQCTDGVAVLISVYDSANSRWKKQMMCTAGIFESDNFTCTFKAKFSGLAGSWQNIITYGTGTHWTNGTYSDGVKWPAGGEIDAFEQAGGYADVPNTMHTPTVHYGSGTNSGYPDTHQSRTGGTVEFTTDQWHDFKFSLNRGYVKVWIDDALVGESDFRDCLVSNNYMADYAPFLKPQAFYIDGSCASGAGAINTSNVYELKVSDFKIIQDAYVECTGLEIYPQMWQQGTELIFPVGAELYLDRVYTPANTSNKACTWESSNSAVATVVQGFVKVLSTGTATITATCGNATAQYVLTAAEEASVPCVKITTDSDDGIIVSGKGSVTISPYLYPSFTTDVTSWGTSDSGIVTVDNGVVSGVAAGKAYITVSCGAVSTVIPVTVTESVKPYISYDFTPLFAYINKLKSSENESVTIANAGTLGSVADLTMTPGTQNYYNDGTYEGNGVVAAYGATSPALNIPLKSNVFAFVYKGINYADRVYTRKDYALKMLLNGTNTNIMPSVAGVVNAYGDYYVRYGGAVEHRFSAKGVKTNIVVYSDGTNSQLYINGEKNVDKGSIEYVAQTLSTLVLNNIDEQIKGLDIYIGKAFAEDELIAMSNPV